MSRQITLSMELIRSLMFEFEGLANLRCLSVTDRGSEVYFPKIIPRELGNILEELNTDGLFYIVHYPSHSEVWHKSHWLDSVSYRWKRIEESNVKLAQYNERSAQLAAKRAKVEQVKQVILKWVPAYGLPIMKEQLASLAYTLSTANEETAKQIPGLYEVLYGEENGKQDNAAGRPPSS